MSFPRYPKYKASGVEWLGDVPEHWDVQRLKRACRVFPSNIDKKSYDGETPVVLCNYTDVYYNERITRAIDFMPATATTDQITKFTLRAGDTIITKDSETADDIAVAAYVPQDLPGVVCGYHLSMVRPMPTICGAFVKRLFDSAYAKGCFATLANGLTRVGLGQYELDNVELPFPPLAEQTAIAGFLDRETGKIDELVAEQRRLIELLKEKRQAVISHAVTKGLNPHAPTKPSGIEWLGDVPGHWEVIALKHLVARPIIDGPHVSPQKYDEGVPFISAESIGKGFIDFDKKWGYISPEDHQIYSQRYKPERGDILLVKLGATTGVPAIVETDMDFSIWVPLAAIRLRKDIHARFIFHVLRSNNLRVAYELNWTYGTQQTLGLGTISNLRVPVPPSAERHNIVKYLDSVLPGFDSLEAEAQRGIELLQERRTALISAAGTGKIDVRNLAPLEVA